MILAVLSVDPRIDSFRSVRIAESLRRSLHREDCAREGEMDRIVG